AAPCGAGGAGSGDTAPGGGGSAVVVHFSTTLEGGDRVVELRTAPDAGSPILDARPGERIELDGGAAVTLISPYPRESERNRLWRATATPGLTGHLARYGRPIRYGYVTEPWPLEAYQTVFATEPGSAEMPSAGRPFTPELVTRLTAAGIVIAPVTLHTGVSSQEAGEPPLPEWFRVPASTARLVNWTRAQGRRVVAVGTTVTRALESAVREDGTVGAAHGWTHHVITSDTPVRVVDSLLTGLHAPDASHLLMLEAIAGAETVQRAYDAALREGYLWHEFGDLSLLHRPR
ncbi:MAG: S-adenosylmethionine:tRNA ribosyltransferase-isomerase, partial [Micromonosporaceae bacterium]